jgi:hypothetical protein
MDDLLLNRYEVLLAGYANGQPGMIEELKAKLIADKSFIRPDGALCLLVLYDELILKAYQGRLYIPMDPASRRTGMGIPKIGKRGFNARVRKSLQIIEKELLKRVSKSGRASSHDVLLAITSRWDELSPLFHWA